MGPGGSERLSGDPPPRNGAPYVYRCPVHGRKELKVPAKRCPECDRPLEKLEEPTAR